MNSKELEKKIVNLEKEVRTLKDIEEINTLQRAYGYYMDNLAYDDAADLFAEDGHAEFGFTVLEGQDKIRASFRNMTKKPFEGTKKLFLHMQLQGVVHVDDVGQTAKGRWQMLCLSVDYLGKPPGELTPIISHGVYENAYSKENGIWKIKRMIFNSSFHSTLYDGWVKTTSLERTYDAQPDVTQEAVDRTWRSGYKVPCHYKNPVTGK
jgi:hypothetical protein